MTGKKINVLEFYKRINEYIELLKIKEYVKQIVFSILKQFEGKQITKRIGDKVKEELPEFTVYYKKGYADFELCIGGNGINHDNTIVFRLGSIAGDKVFKFDTFHEHPTWYNFWEHATALQEFKNNAEQHINNWNSLIDLINERTNEFKDIPYPASEFFYFKNLIF